MTLLVAEPTRYLNEDKCTISLQSSGELNPLSREAITWLTGCDSVTRSRLGGTVNTIIIKNHLR